jgi:ABC-type branched-subunit amino acid transport system substrate-binding protein
MRNTEIRKRSRILIAGSCLLFLVVLFVSGAGKISAARTAPRTQASSTVNVGILFPLTGPVASAGARFLSGAQTGIDEVNAHGGVRGNRIKQFVADTAGDAVDTVPALRQLQSHHLNFLIGPTSIEFSSIKGIVDSSKLTDFANIPGTQFDNLNDKYVYRVLASDSILARGMAYYALHKGWKTCSIMFENVESAQALLPVLQKSYTAHGGKIAANVQLTPHATSYRSEVVNAFQKKPQCLFLQTDPTTSGTLFTDIRQLGYYNNTGFVGTDEYTDINVANAIGLSGFSPQITGMQGATPAGPAFKYFTSLYQKKHSNLAPSYFTAANYDVGIIAALAMTAAKSTDSKVWLPFISKVAGPPGIICSQYARCVKLLKANKEIDYQGASGPVDYDSTHSVTTGFDVVTFDSSGVLQKVLSITAKQLSNY